MAAIKPADRLNRFGDDRIPIALPGDLSSLLLQGIALLIDARAFGLDLSMQFDVFRAALRVRFDESFGGLEHLAVVGLNQPVLLGLAIGAFDGTVRPAARRPSYSRLRSER